MRNDQIKSKILLSHNSDEDKHKKRINGISNRIQFFIDTYTIPRDKEKRKKHFYDIIKNVLDGYQENKIIKNNYISEIGIDSNNFIAYGNIVFHIVGEESFTYLNFYVRKKNRRFICWDKLI